MSITISDWKQISQAPTNRSKSKMSFSFSKAQRFHTNQSDKSTIFYEIPPTTTKRTTSLGRGNKSDFTKNMPQTPPSNTYNIPSGFKGKDGFCFGQGREQMIITGPLAQTLNNKNPGPGSYEPMKRFANVAYTMKSKVKPPQPQAQKVPGPGTYKQNNFFEDKQLILSNYTSHKAATFGKGGQRFKLYQSMSPGPAHYSTKTVQMSSQGHSKVRSFGQAIRKPINQRSQTPGPGSYRAPSEFGYYDKKRGKRMVIQEAE